MERVNITNVYVIASGQQQKKKHEGVCPFTSSEMLVVLTSSMCLSSITSLVGTSKNASLI